MGVPGGSLIKNLPANEEDASSILGWGRSPGEGKGNPLQYFCLGKSHGQKSLEGYSPWGHKESDMTESLSQQMARIHMLATISIFIR